MLLRVGWVAFIVFAVSGAADSVILTPPYFNLAEGRRIYATATCGEDITGPELYCKLVGANSERDEHVNLIQGQVCDYCDPSQPSKRHPPEFAVDGAETWWQSPPLSRGSKYNEVNLTIDLGQEFHVAYVFIKMANSPRPDIWVLERSIDNGKTYQPWQYFADNPGDCETYFGRESIEPITRDDSVICETQYSKVVPLEGGEIVVSLLNNRPSSNDFFNSTVLQEWTRATNIRLRLIRTKTLLGHLMSIARQDPTVTRRYFYSIKDISIGGRCVCNGHADTCDIIDPEDPFKLLCNCQHNTCGANCDRCCPGYEQKAWRISKSYQRFVCEPCNCFGHSEECTYDEKIDEQRLSLDIHGNYDGGGVCKNCRDHTEGINCDRCQAGYFRPFGRQLNETDVCQPCDCNNFFSTGNCAEGTGQCECRQEFTPPDCKSCSYGYFGYPECRPCECHLNGTRGFLCEAEGGQCPCKQNFGGKFCKICNDGYYSFPDCLPCECNRQGAISDICDLESGQCTCNSNFGGRTCDQCKDGYYRYPECEYCNCDVKGTLPGICNKDNGTCLCKEGYEGKRCDRCSPGYYGYPDCKPCGCSKNGSISSTCDISGKCQCKQNYAGRTCEKCNPGYYRYPDCLPCNCDPHGNVGVSCDSEGKCQCKPNFDGNRCEQCKEGFYNFPICEECNCDPSGVVATFAGCGSLPPGELCQCKERVHGRICDTCRPLYWNLQAANPEGCEECDCHTPGVVGGLKVCDGKSGQCMCKPFVTSRRCDECSDGTYNLEERNLFGCTDCGCDIGGAVDNTCNKESGQCTCRPRITGRTCNEPLQTHYFPTLHQFQYEVEDGHTPVNTAVRFGYDESLFPKYSWKGYAVFSLLQNEVIQDIYITKPTIYRMVLRYVNMNNDSVTGVITVTPDNPSDIEQNFVVQFPPSRSPAFVTVSTGNIPSPFVLNPGRWSVSIKNDRNLLLDYFVLLPAAYYEATTLVDSVDAPCIEGNTGFCRHFKYPNVSYFDTVRGGGAYVHDGDMRSFAEVFYEPLRIPLINDEQPEIHLDLRVTKPGKHILLINYLTPFHDQPTAVINVETSSQHGRNKGVVNLSACSYNMSCRQSVLDRQGRVAAFNFDSNDISITLKQNEKNPAVAIESVVAIPQEEWSLDYQVPKPACVKKDNKCIQATFLKPADSKRVDFERGNEDRIAKVVPPLFDNTTQLIYLDKNDSVIDIIGKVPNPGTYVFVVHYFQPDHAGFRMDVLVHNGQMYEAKLPVEHCPSNSGCRSIVKDASGNTKFNLVENYVFTLKEPNGKSVWLDYLLVIPENQFTDRVLHEEPVDHTGTFIKYCSHDHFHVNTSDKGFCRDSVFSLTSDYNNGALPCQCDFDGSSSFECEKFGGQCPCHPNVIGRRCDACRTGYFGFPNCQPCNCPSTALCEARTGECICPPRVKGERCDQCEAYTYGFDPIIGCEECNCNAIGVLRGNLQCDLFNGTCQCKPNVVGRTCDKCQPGHWAFPHCLKCDCDERGTTNEICNQNTAECFCKNNVNGQACDVCNEGTFNIQERNPDGCTKCFCFGRTTRCSSSSLYRAKVTELDGWELVLTHIGEEFEIETVSHKPEFLHTYVGADLSTNEAVDNVVYFSAPAAYLGNKLTSYGGGLSYSITYLSGSTGNAVTGADVILLGRDFTLLHHSIEQPANDILFSTSVDIVETNFILPNGVYATREQIMQTLANLKGVFIRATYWNPSITARLERVSLDTATEVYSTNTSRALSVEQCTCPPSYQGLSCQDCAPGYYRSQTGPYGGFCVPCQCNGHSDVCDQITGVCHDCKHNTVGDHCEKCAVGYHGDATEGTPIDCLICACPVPTPSNNFATGCQVSPDGERISCDCMPGYYGATCQSCAAGFYGKPRVIGDYCKPCQCSGNIDPDDPGSCDSVTGECLRCLNNTSGMACNLCAPGYYGDAVELKDCQSCVCDKCGTRDCDSYSGKCRCLDNVVGEKCDRCELEHYGFSSCQGCRPCECGLASEGHQCDDTSGQCRCKPGVSGRTCDRCAAGFWNYGPEGCASCGCNTEYSIGFGCNPKTGQCECLPGVIGEKCDRCPYRWVLKPGEGCFECDTCHHTLLDLTDELELLLRPVLDEFESVAKGYFTQRRLGYINETLNNLRPQVDLLSPNQTDFREITQEIESLEQDSKNIHRLAEYSIENGEYSADNIYKDAIEVEELIIRAADKAQTVVKEVQELAASLEDGAGTRVEDALKEAQDILSHIQAQEFSKQSEAAVNELSRALDLLNRIQKFTLPVKNQTDAFQKIQDDIDDFGDKLDDLQTHSQDSIDRVGAAETLNARHRNAKLMGTVDSVNRYAQEANSTLEESKELLKNASDLLNKAKQSFAPLNDTKKELARRTADVENTMDQIAQEMDDTEKVAKEASEHANRLAVQGDLDTQFQPTRQFSESAVQAASAYKNIINATEEALKAAHAASSAADNAINMSQGLGERTSNSQTRSSELLDDARETLRRAQEELAPRLEDARDSVNEIQDLNKESEEGDNMINRLLDPIANMTLEAVVTQAVEDSNVADQFARTALQTISTITDQLEEDEKQAKELPRTVDKTKRAISLATIQINSISNMIPESDELVDRVEESQSKISAFKDDMEDRIKRVKREIARAESLINRVKVGVTFYPNTTLQLKYPDSLPKPGTTTDLSFYFRTNELNGLLLYLGNEIDTHRVMKRSKTDDFLAIEIQNGYPVLIMDVGSGNKTVINEKYVADNMWYQALVERLGKVVKFTIREEVADGQEERHESQAELPGVHSIFNLDEEHSLLFVGGYPATFNLQPIDYSSFTGQMEELVIGETPISLWNFIDAVNNQGARERDRLVNLQPNTGYRFDGNGYVIINGTLYNLRDRSSIQLQFKTNADNGLLFLTAGRRSFLSIELRNGKILYQYDLGRGPATAVTADTYNDGKWHTVDVARQGLDGVLQVDDGVRVFTVAEGDTTSLDVHNHIYFGGYPGRHHFSSVTNLGFDGCIDHAQIEIPVDLSQNIQAFGVTSGCPIKVASLVAFEETSPGYVIWPNASANNFMQLNLKFKTPVAEGLIFYATNRDNSATISLSIVNGILYLNSQGEELTSNQKTYNDNEWHVVMATHDSSSLRLDVDDFDMFSTDAPPKELRFLYGRLLFGGIPDGFAVQENAVATNAPFVGCLGDATINGVFINFANITEKRNALLGKCTLEQTETTPLPPLPPTIYSEPDEPVVDVPKTTPATTMTTTTTTTTTTTVSPPSAATCTLPIPPATDTEVTEEDGFRFGTILGSRHEFASSPQEYKNKFTVSLDFKTFSEEGIIFYATGNKQIDFIGLFMKDGQIHYNFNCGSGVARLESVGTYNDGQWHNVKFSRNKTSGELLIDDKEVVEGKSPGRSKTLEITTVVYVGSIAPSLASDAKVNLQGINGTFEGCIRNILVNGKPLKKPTTSVGVIPCSNKVETGTYFSEDGGYLKVREKFSVGLQIAITMDIKPRNVSGLLLSVHGKRDFVMLQMVNGVIKFSVDNGKGPISSSFKLKDEYSFCDGQWHNIQAVKSKNVVSLSVDNVSTEPTIGLPGTSSTDTIYPLFVGGHPRRLAKVSPRGLETKQQYTGCIRNLYINGMLERLSSGQAVGNVTSSICPTI